MNSLALLAAIGQQLVGAREAMLNSRALFAECDPDSRLYPALRSGLIKDFELTYELAVKLAYKLVDERLGHVRKYKPLETFIKEASELGILALAPEAWSDLRTLRNSTVDLFDEQLAHTVAYSDLTPFLREIEALIELSLRNRYVDA